MGFARIFRAAGRRDDHITAALSQDRQGVNHDLMVLVPPELVWQIEKVRRQPVMRKDVRWVRGEEVGRRLGRKPNHGDVVSQTGIEPAAVAQGAFTAEHDAAAGSNLGTEAQIALPSRGPRKELRQPAMLKIRKPCQRWKRQPPAEEPRGFEHEIDAARPEFGRGRAINPRRKCRQEAGTTTVKLRKCRRLHHFNARNVFGSRKFQRIVIHPRKQHGLDFTRPVPGKCGEEVILVVVAASPNPTGDVGERDTKGRALGHESSPLNHFT